MFYEILFGLLLYYWLWLQIFDFYMEVVVSFVDIVYVGEMVCSCCYELWVDDWFDIVVMLCEVGKLVVLLMCMFIEISVEVQVLCK